MSDERRTGPATWTRPADVLARLRIRFDRGEFLADHAAGAPFEPIGVPLRGPSAGDLGTEFTAAREWVRLWTRQRNAAIRLEYRDVGGRVIGANRLPARAWIDDRPALWTALGVGRTVQGFEEMLAEAAARAPAIRDWAAANPMKALAHADDWDDLLATAVWIERNQRPGQYLRQVDVPGVDTKFIESNRAILTDILERLLPPERIDPSAPRTDFAARHRFAAKPVYVRVRSLDSERPVLGLFSEASVRADELAAHPLPARRIVIVENEITYLALPPLADAAAIWGGGYAIGRLTTLPWLAERDLAYWGDIDTHGFAILDRLRRAFPAAESILMDRETLLDHRTQWVRESTPVVGELENLTRDEHALYLDLIGDAFGPAVRLEQERVGFHAAEQAFRRLDSR